MQTLQNNEQLKYSDGQKYCIENPNGICIAIAGPGTGKTYAIAHRIKTIIKNGCDSNRILCLTFTDTAARHMNQSIKKAFLEENLPTENLNVNTCTFHSFCMDVIKNNLCEFELKDGIKVIPDTVSRMFIKKITDEIESENLKTESGSRYQYIDAIISAINDIKKYNISKVEFEDNLNESDLSDKEKSKTQDLWLFYEKYEQEKNERGYIDFSDMIIKVVQKFQDKEFLSSVASQYDYILVDEYQDTNPLQNQIVYHLAEFCPNIFVVGDDDQTIYSFQGAKITTMKEYIEHFENLGKTVDVVTFNNNRRSSQNIIDISRDVVLMQKNYTNLIRIKENNLSNPAQERLSNYELIFPPLEHDQKFAKYKINKKLNAVNEKLKNTSVQLREYNDIDDEKYAIVEKIKELKNTVPLNEIAILTRSNSQLNDYAELLKRNNIDYELKEGKNIFEINSVNILLCYLYFLISPDLYSAKLFNYLLSPIFNINPKDYTLLFKNRAHGSIIDAIKVFQSEEKFIEPDKINKFLSLYESHKDIKEGISLDEFILLVINETGILDYYINLESGRVENLLALKKFVQEAQGFSEIHIDLDTSLCLKGFLNYIQDFIDNDVKISYEKPDYKQDAIQLSTIHSSKGKEYGHVFIPSLNKSKWESLSSGGLKVNVPYKKDRNLCLRLAQDDLKAYEKKWINSEAKYMELIKLLFVAITRAKEGLYLSYTDNSNNANVFVKVLKQDFADSKNLEFIDNIKEEIKEVDVNELCNQLKSKRYDYKKDFFELIDMKIADIKAYSPTKLNAWSLCRRRFLLEYVLSMGIDKPNDITEYGSAIHNTLDEIVKEMIKSKTYPTLDRIKQCYIKNMSKLPFTPEGKKEYSTKGEIKLNDYFEIIKSWDIKNLYKSEEMIDDFEIRGEKFCGKIDRIDKDENGNYIIYDYKTGGTKSTNDISKDGKNENYYNQIAFYKYLLSKSENVDINKIRTVFLFPDNSSKTEIILSEQDCIDVVEKYFDTINKLKEHNFDKGDIKNKEKTCKYCTCQNFCNANYID